MRLTPWRFAQLRDDLLDLTELELGGGTARCYELLLSMTSEQPSSARPKGKSATAQGGLFPATQWSEISMVQGTDEARATEGLRGFAVNYWKPLYLYLRRRGESHEDASDSVQGFFEHVFSTGFLNHVDREGGKFRSYVLKSLERWRSGKRYHDWAQKRGGRAIHVAMDGVDELLTAVESQSAIAPELAFDRQWAIDLVGRAVDSVRGDYARRGRDVWFEALCPALPGGGQLPPYAELAVQLGASEGAIKKAVFDLRSAFSTSLRQEIRATVRTNQDADEELRYLIAVISEH
ncbi:MAG: hypothetical protein R3F19_34505 [Verrucomicrobiales bacterium]